MNALTKNLLVAGMLLFLSGCAHYQRQSYYPYGSGAYGGGYSVAERNYYGGQPYRYDNYYYPSGGTYRTNNYYYYPNSGNYRHDHDHSQSRPRWPNINPRHDLRVDRDRHKHDGDAGKRGQYGHKEPDRRQQAGFRDNGNRRPADRSFERDHSGQARRGAAAQDVRQNQRPENRGAQRFSSRQNEKIAEAQIKVQGREQRRLDKENEKRLKFENRE